MSNIGKDGWSEIDWICEAAQHEESNNFRRYCDWYSTNQTMKEMEDESKKISSIRTKKGWSEGGMFKRISSMPLHIFNIMRRLDPEFAVNTKRGRAKLIAFVQRRKEFSVD